MTIKAFWAKKELKRAGKDLNYFKSPEMVLMESPEVTPLKIKAFWANERGPRKVGKRFQLFQIAINVLH